MKHTVCTRVSKNGTPILIIDLRKLGETMLGVVVIGVIIFVPTILPYIVDKIL